MGAPPSTHPNSLVSTRRPAGGCTPSNQEGCAAMTPANPPRPLQTPKDVAPFLKQLRRMLDEESTEVLRWTPNGRAFEIVDMEQMTHNVLPRYFKHCKYTSFQRQLNYFNFRKWTKSKAKVCTFSNACFVRDQPELAWRITRKKSTHASPAKRGLPQPSRDMSESKHCPEPRPDDSPHTRQPFEFKEAAVAISVPYTSYSSAHAALPSPTDLDMMPYEHEYCHEVAPALQHTSGVTFNTSAICMDHVDSLDWIDVLLPLIDHMDDEKYPHAYCYSPSLALEFI